MSGQTSGFGALLRHYRERAGLTHAALSGRADVSEAAIASLERGRRQSPYPDTVRRLAEALALAPDEWSALRAAAMPRAAAPQKSPATVLPPALPSPEPEFADAVHSPADVAESPALPGFLPLPPAPLLVGRASELAVLRGCLAESLAGRGGLVLIGGAAGAGKTALAETLCREAAEQGALVLIGRCYDLTETPPYGPWAEAWAQFPATPGLPPPPSALQTAAQSPAQFFAEVRAFFAAAVAQQPLVLLLDDLQWADAASLDLLRALARALQPLRLLLLVCYRPDEIDRHHPLSSLLPLLVREARATRLAVPPLPAAALRELVGARYALPVADEERLGAYLARRSEGNALFATELLHALEEAGALTPGGTEAGDFTLVAVPPLLRQVVEGRVARLGSAAESLLDIAAVIGQEMPLEIWAEVAGVDAAAVEAAAERALAAVLLVETRGGERVGFAHALIREALYEAIPAPRRRRLHRQAGDVLAALPAPNPDAVAYHFGRAGDPRATEWLKRAAWQAYRALAHKAAGARFEAVLPETTGVERARVLLALAGFHRYQERGIRYAEEAVQVARAAGEDVLAAMVQFRLGMTLSYHERMGEALRAVEAAGTYLDTLPDTAMADVPEFAGRMNSRDGRRQDRAYLLAMCGRWREAQGLLDEPPAYWTANGLAAIVRLGSLRGHPDTIRAGIRDCVDRLAQLEDILGILTMRILEGTLLLQPFQLDDEAARQRHEAAITADAKRAEDVLGTAPILLGRCALLIVVGRWAEAQALWARRADAFFGGVVAAERAPVGVMARAQGQPDAAWALVREGLPDGPLTAPGTTYSAALDLYTLAARLALDVDDHALARQWLEAHDRWLVWAGPEVRPGRVDGQLAWAEYHRAMGDAPAALRHTDQALAAATTPRQPLLLLTGHRLRGELLGAARRDDEARAQFDIALALADACGAPYERALTLLAGAALDAVSGHAARAGAALHMVRAICVPLGAEPILLRAETLAATVARARRRVLSG